MKIIDTIKTPAVGMSLAALLLFGGCSDYDTTAYDQNQPGEVAVESADTTTVPGVYTGVYTEAEDTTGVYTEDASMADSTAQPPDYDLSNARVAEMSYRVLQDRMNDVEQTLSEVESKLAGQEVDGLQELNQRAEQLSEEVADVDEDETQAADPELVKDVLEVQVETDEFSRELDL